MSSERSRSRQLTIVFTDERLWMQLPEENRRRCQALLVQLLSEVVRDDEAQERRSRDE